MIKILQRFMSTLNSTLSRLEQAKTRGSAQTFLLKQSVCWSLIKCLPHFAFVPLHFTCVSNITPCKTFLIYSPHHLRRQVPLHLTESLSSGNYRSNQSLLLTLLFPGSPWLCWAEELFLLSSPTKGWGKSPVCHMWLWRSNYAASC